MRRVRLAYEWDRMKWALLGSSPVLGVLGVAALLGDSVRWSLACGLTAFALGVAFLFYGRGLHRGVLPGLVAGLVPLSFVLAAKHAGHFCTGESCTTLCMQACVVGGILAGLAVARVGAARRSGPGFFVSASALAILTGAMGCMCLGASGMVGLALGYAGGLVPGIAARLFGGREAA